jgi:hypothetical protein
MTTLTVKVSGKKEAKLLYEMLRSMKFVKKVDLNDENDWNESEKEILDERLEDFNRNPKTGRTLEEVVKKISRRHGFKNHH